MYAVTVLALGLGCAVGAVPCGYEVWAHELDSTLELPQPPPPLPSGTVIYEVTVEAGLVYVVVTVSFSPHTVEVDHSVSVT